MGESPSKARILVVDDEPSVLLTYRLLLEQRGYDVMCALSRVARETAIRIKADIVMYDVGPNVGPLHAQFIQPIVNLAA